MKKIFLAISMVTLFAAGAFAQGVSGGLKGGVNISNAKFSGDGFSASYDSKVGFHIGGYLTAMLSENFGVQPELLFSNMGAKFDDEAVNLNYISIPIMLRYNITENFNLQAGPQAGFLMSAKYDGEDIKDAYKGIDFGVAFGLGVDFGKINAGARYYAGLSNIGEDEFLEDSDVKLKNNAVQIFLGVKLFGE